MNNITKLVLTFLLGVSIGANAQDISGTVTLENILNDAFSSKIKGCTGLDKTKAHLQAVDYLKSIGFTERELAVLRENLR